MNLEQIGPRALYAIAGLILGSLLAVWLRGQPTETVKVITAWKTRTVVEVKEVIKYKEKVKWKEKVVYRSDGSIASVTTSGANSQSTMMEQGSITSTEMERSTEYVSQTMALSRYRLGLEASWTALLVAPTDWINYRASIYARVGDLPIFAGAYLQSDLRFGVGLTYEF